MFLALIFGDTGVYPYEIKKSLRLRASASAYLSRTPSVEGNFTTWTQNFWCKRGALGTTQELFGARVDGNNYFRAYFDSADRLVVDGYVSAVQRVLLVTTQVFRDPTAAYAITLVADSTQATANDRFRIYVNGGRITAFSTSTYPSQGLAVSTWNDDVVHNIGRYVTGINYLDGYLAEVNFVDGQALTPTAFGEFRSGTWVPKKYVGTYGVNGFYLPFNDGTSLTALTQDRSGNGNNWTANNISLTAGATYDWMDDTPTNNFAVLNSLYTGKSTLSNGNLTASGATDLPTIVPESGTWYFERGGVSRTWTPPAAFPAGSGDYNFGQRPWQSTGPAGGQKALCTKNLPVPTITKPSEHFQTVLATGSNIKSQMDALFSGDVFEWIKDRANSNNHQLMDVSRGLTAVLQANTTAAETVYSAPAGSSVGWVWKAGGAPVVNNAGSIPSQVSANVLAGFSIVTYTGNGAFNGSVGHGLGVVPKLTIVKNRGVSAWTVYTDVIDGSKDYLYLHATNAKGDESSSLPTSSVVYLGGSVGDNANGNTYVSYCFAEIPGFSKISPYTGNGSADGTFVYCGFRPKFILIKRTNAAGNWVLLDSSRAGYNVDNDPLYANGTNAEATTDLLDITATGFKLRSTNADVNASGGTYIFLAVAEVPLNYANAR